MAVAVALVTSCGVDAPDWEVSAVNASLITTTSTTPRPPPTTRAVQPPTSTTKPKPRYESQLAQVRGNQAIVVTASKYGATTAQFTAYQRTAGGWKATLGPWSAWVGAKGIAPPGAKREGDLRTPSGTYGFDFFFGVQPDPGVKFPYRVVIGPNIAWVEDPASPNYNRWVDTAQEDAGANPDGMYKPQYNYGAVVAYNTAARTPGVGSGIFIHVSRNRPSAGCITLPVEALLAVLRWLDPATAPVIVIGVV